MLASLVLLALASISHVWAAPHILNPVKRHASPAGNGKYLVTFRNNPDEVRSFGALSAKAMSWAARVADNSTYNGWIIANGFSAALNEEEIQELQASKDVLTIEEDNIVTTLQDRTQEDAPWNLGRISQSARLANQNALARTFSYTFPESAGRGVDIYVFDTGIRTTHSEFGGRASQLNFLGLGNEDVQGHGTHCAGTAAGASFGVAKEANIIGVKVLGDSGSGRSSDIIFAVQEAAKIALASGRPFVFSLSLGGGFSPSMNNVMKAVVSSGVHVVVAAGNEGEDSRNTSPGGAIDPISVGATDISDNIAVFSNFGPRVDVFAPGVQIQSASHLNDFSGRVLSGTSMACPLVAGMVAVLLSEEGNVTPAQMKEKIASLSVGSAIQGLNSITPNLLVNL